MDRQDVQRRIERFVREQFSVGASDPHFDRTADLFEGGYVDSVGVVELVAFVDQEFGVEIPERMLMSDDFSTIEGIARIVCELS